MEAKNVELRSAQTKKKPLAGASMKPATRTEHAVRLRSTLKIRADRGNGQTSAVLEAFAPRDPDAEPSLQVACCVLLFVLRCIWWRTPYGGRF